VEAFGERIQPLMKSRIDVDTPVPTLVKAESLAA
jgi:pyrimidine oxygenase